jgi:Fe-S cluster assembly iron-binding protein IscA
MPPTRRTDPSAPERTQESAGRSNEAAPELLDPQQPEPEISPPRVFFTAPARDRIREMLEEEDLLEEGGLRLSARPGAGCSAPTRFGMILEVGPRADDLVLEGGGVRIFLDPTSAWALDGLRVDWVESAELGSGFAFRQGQSADGPTC